MKILLKSESQATELLLSFEIEEDSEFFLTSFYRSQEKNYEFIACGISLEYPNDWICEAIEK